MKKSRGEGKERVRACRSSVSKIIISHLDTLECNQFCVAKGVGRQHTAFTLCQNAAFSNDFFLSVMGRLCPGGFSFN